MKRILLLLSLLLCVSLPATAQDTSEDDGGTALERLLEDSLSSEGTDVRITGFRGALSSQATMERMTIADADGVWLTLEGAVLDWSRLALLRGAVEVNKLSADKLVLSRLPEGSETTSAPSPEATRFALPDLPVSINVGELSIASAEIGAPVMGEEIVLSLDGSASLAGGEGKVDMAIERIDGETGALKLAGSYANDSETLSLDLSLEEGAGGILVTKAGLPGAPSLALTVKGDGPLDDFAADLQLATDGQERMGGQVTLRGTDDGGRRFSADVSGDLRPLLPPEHRAFFGPEQVLRTSGLAAADGSFDLDALELRTAAINLTGKASIGADGWPELLELEGKIASEDGTPVRLVTPQEVTLLDSATLSLAFDASQGDAFTLDLTALGLDRPEMSLAETHLTGTGTISRNADAAVPGAVAGDLVLDVSGLAFADESLAQAAGDRMSGKLSFDWQENAPFKLTGIDLTGAGVTLGGDVTVAGISDGGELTITPDLTVNTRDISRFSGLAGRPLSGGADLALSGKIEPVAGRFDLALNGAGTDLGSGIAQLDGLLAGTLALNANASRDETGTFLRKLTLDGPGIKLAADAELKTGATSATFDLRLPDLARVQSGMGGAAALSGTVNETEAAWLADFTLSGPGGTDANGHVEAAKTEDGIGTVSFTGHAAAEALSAFAPLAGQAIAGGVTFDGSASYAVPDGSLAADGTLVTNNLAVGIPTADGLIGGTGKLEVSVSRDASGTLNIKTLNLSTPELTGSVSGSYGTGDSAISYDLALRDLGRIVEQLPGRATAQGTLSSSGDGPWQVDTALTGPAGTQAKVAGSIARDFATANIGIDGAVPLALANRLAAPNLLSGLARLNLRLNGPLDPSSLSGSINVAGAQVVLPGPALTLTDLSVETTLSGGRVQLSTDGELSTGGRIRTSGTISLAAPYTADLAVKLRNLVLQDRRLYQAEARGDVTVKGPLLTGPSIGGRIEIENAEVRIPETGLGPGSRSFTLTHISEPAASRETRERAGLIDESSDASGPGYVLPLDLVISAPSKIFIRGRGLDAELGGELKLGGTSADIIPEGRFDLIRGRLDILGQRLTLEQAILRLTGDFIPMIEVTATTERDGTAITVSVEGEATSPEVSFSSDPSRPEEEVLALLLFGRDISEISAIQALRIAAAVNTLAGKGGAGIVGNLRQGFGLDDLDVTTDDEGNAGLRMGKYISDNIYTDVEVDSSGETSVNLNIQVSPNVKARGSVTSAGDSGLGVFFEKDY